MAMTKCKECKQEVSNKAQTCPNCGIKDPGKKENILAGILVWIVLIFVAFYAFSSDDDKKSTPAAVETATPQKTPEQIADEETKRLAMKDAEREQEKERLADFVVSIKTVASIKGIKRSMEVVLKQKASKEDLHAIGLLIKEEDRKTYERTFIEYDYQGQPNADNWAWATTHFNPEIKVRILGLSVEEERAFREDKDMPFGEIIGIWLVDRAGFSHKATLYKQDGQLKMEQKASDLSKNSHDITEATLSGKPIYKYDNNFGEYYRINADGDLEVWDQDGLFLTSAKIQ